MVNSGALSGTNGAILTDQGKSLDPFGWVGATVDGKYRVDAVIGEGGFGVVYRAHHLGFEENVALKCLRMPAMLVGEERDRFFTSFLAEGRLLHRLSRATAGIVQALDVGAAVSPSGVWTPFLVLEWLDGRTLDHDFDERQRRGFGGRSLAEAIELLEPAARALALAHEQGIAHRDIKPANLFIADVGGRHTVKVLDFGIAKVITETASLTRAFEVTGSSLQAFTARYGSPEQFSRRFGATGPWTDVFSLALVLVETVSGRQALEGEDAAQLFVAAADEHRRPTLLTCGISTSEGIEAVLRSALAVDPKERYLNAGEFWDALIAAARAEGILLTRPPRRTQASVAFLDSMASLEAEAASSPAAETRRLAPEASTQLASSTQVPLTEPRSFSLIPATRPTPLRLAIAVAASAAVFSLVAGIGLLLWTRASDEHAPLLVDSAGSAASITARLLPSASSSAGANRASPPPRSDAPLPPPGGIAGSTPGEARAPTNVPLPPGVPPLEVPEGRVAGTNIWFGKFRAWRHPDNMGRSFVEAQTHCSQMSMALCTEAEWRRACQTKPALGENPSWTASAEPNGFVVRGGGSCEARSIAPGDSLSPERSGVCCDRAVGVDTKNTNRSFLAATADRLLEIERTLNVRNTDGFLSLLADGATIDGATRTRENAGKLLDDSFREWPDQWVMSEVCAVSIKPATVIKRSRWGKKRRVESSSWTADCTQMRYRGGQLAVVTTSYVFTGAGKLRSVTDLKVARDWSKL